MLAIIFAGEWLQSRSGRQMVQVSSKEKFQNIDIGRSRGTGNIARGACFYQSMFLRKITCMLQLKKQQRREQNRWMMLKRNQALAEAEEQKAQQDQMGRSKVRIGTENSEKRRGQSRDDDEMDELDFEDVFQDDEEGGGEFEFEDEEMKESKVCIFL